MMDFAARQDVAPIEAAARVRASPVVAAPCDRAYAAVEFLRSRLERKKHADAVADDMCGGYVHALLVRQDGRWQVRRQVICATDVPWASWPEYFGAPAALFPRLG